MDFQSDAFQTYALCSAILAIKMAVSGAYTGTLRSRVQGYLNPEDVATFGKRGTATRSEEPPEVARALRIQRNDVENIPAFFALGLLYVLTGASALGAAVYCWGFTLARIGHTVAYARELQPARTIFFGIGLLANLGMAVTVIWRSL
jgi:uncharacterized MAPEG superfamily protein